MSTSDPFAANRRKEKAIARREKNHGFKIGDDGKIVIELDEIDYRRKKKEDEVRESCVSWLVCYS